jgi:hypothetical protein
LRQCTVRHHNIAPHSLENLTAAHRRLASLDQQHEQIKIAGNQRQDASVPRQLPLPYRESEFAEPVSVE